MTEVLAPPPPPPPPPPAPRSSNTIDFIRPFAFAFEDPRWLPKFLLGGLFVLLSFMIIGLFFILGYLARLTRNVIAGERHPLPEWDDLGAYFVEGVRLFAVGFVYILPIFAIIGFFIVPVIIAQQLDIGEMTHKLSEAVAAGAWCLIMPISLALSVWLPGALLMSAVDQSFGAGFDFGRIGGFIRANAANYILAFIIWLIARFAASLGFLLFCVGIVFTIYWSYVVGTYAFAEAYRLSNKSR